MTITFKAGLYFLNFKRRQKKSRNQPMVAAHNKIMYQST